MPKVIDIINRLNGISPSVWQAEVIKFAVDAVRAEAFNARTLFLFGSYTIGKERLFLEVARQLQMKVWPTP